MVNLEYNFSVLYSAGIMYCTVPELCTVHAVQIYAQLGKSRIQYHCTVQCKDMHGMVNLEYNIILYCIG